MSLAFVFITTLALVSQEDSQTLRIRITSYQEDPSKQLQSLLLKLRSDRIEERDQAALEIRKLGKAAIPELEKLAAEKDLDVSTTARTLIRQIRLRDMLGVDLKDLENLPATTIVEWMEKKTQHKFLFTTDLGLGNRRVRVHPDLIDVSDPYTVGVDLLRSVDIGVCPSESVPGGLELFPAPLGGKRPLKIYKSAAELPKANEFCSLVLQLKRVSPRAVQAMLINIMSFPQNCLSAEELGGLILSDYSSVLRRCAEIAAGLDVSRSFRIDVALLEARAGKELSVPEAYRDLKLVETTGFQQFSAHGVGSTRLERTVRTDFAAKAPAEKTSIRYPGASLIVEFDGTIRAAGGPTLERFILKREGERQLPLLETRFETKDDRWMFVGSVPTEKEGVSIVVLTRAVPD